MLKTEKPQKSFKSLLNYVYFLFCNPKVSKIVREINENYFTMSFYDKCGPALSPCSVVLRKTILDVC